jgi:hypothetical protein
MPILECPGVFQVVLPDGWVVRAREPVEYDIEAPGVDAAITITVFPKPTDGRDSADAVRSFARSLGVGSADSLAVVTPTSRGQDRSFASVSIAGGHWFIGCLFFKRDFVLATFNTKSDDADVFHRGEMIIASIAPMRRRFLRSR